jgi:hypothetical protein
MFIGLVGYENTCCMLRIESRYKGAYNNSLINTERQATLQKKRYTMKRLKINNYELLNNSNMNLVKTCSTWGSGRESV